MSLTQAAMSTPSLTGLTAQAALVVSAAGVVAALAAFAATRQVLAAVPAALDFFLAAGLLRLVGRPGWSALGSAALILLIRRVVGVGLRQSKEVLDQGRPG